MLDYCLIFLLEPFFILLCQCQANPINLVFLLCAVQTSIKTMDQVDLMREQLKILSGEVALQTSVLKRLTEEALNSPNKEQIQVPHWSTLLFYILQWVPVISLKIWCPIEG